MGSSKRHIYVSGLCNEDGVLREVRDGGKLTPVNLNITMEHDHISIVKPTRCTISQIYFILEQHSTFQVN